MIRVAIEMDVDTKDQAAVNSSVNRFLSDLSEVGTAIVYRSDVLGAPDPDQAEADMIAGYRGQSATQAPSELVRDAGS